jgi:hypothetical protein
MIIGLRLKLIGQSTSISDTANMGTYQGGGMMEGLGGPIRMNPYTADGIDPALDECCQREVS